MKQALLVVDVQNDFVTGSLAVPGAKDIIPNINRYINQAREAGAIVAFSRDMHPPNHISFKKHGGGWPDHCVMGTQGANFPEELDIPKTGAVFVVKATTVDRDAYSAFDHTGLDSIFRNLGVDTLQICGIATDYCVKASVLEARKLGYSVRVMMDAVAAVTHEGGAEAIKEMLASGARIGTGGLFLQPIEQEAK